MFYIFHFLIIPTGFWYISVKKKKGDKNDKIVDESNFIHTPFNHTEIQ